MDNLESFIMAENVIEPIPREEPIPYLDKSELVEGGIEGPANKQAKSIANNLAYQKEQLKKNAELWVDVTNYLNEYKENNTDVVLAAIAKAKEEKKGVRCCPRAEVELMGDIDFSDIRCIDWGADILNKTGTVIIGGFSNSGIPADIKFQRITNGTSALNGPIPAIDTIRFEGIKAGVVTVGQTNLLRIHAVGGNSKKGSNAYFELNLTGSVRAFRVSDEGEGGWNNNITVNGGRLIDLDVTGTGYTPNELLFDRNTFEGSLVKIRFKRAWTNRILNARFEGVASAPGVIFEADTMQNTIVQRWSGSGSTRGQFSFSPNVIDYGKGNNCLTHSFSEFDAVELFSIGPKSVIANSTTSTSQDPKIAKPFAALTTKQKITPHLKGIEFLSNRIIALSEIFPVSLGDVVKFDCDFEGKLIRPTIYIYDENYKPIKTGGDHIKFAGAKFNPAGYYYFDADLDVNALALGFSVDNSSVKYLQVSVHSAASGFARHLSAYLLTQKLNRKKSATFLKSSQVLPALDGVPTQGFADVGYTVLDSLVNVQNDCIFSFESLLTAAAANGATVLNVEKVTGIKLGDVFGVQLVSGLTHWGSVVSISGNALTVSPALSADCEVNSRIVFNRWKPRNIVSKTVYDPESIPANGSISVNVPVTGVVLGDVVFAGFSRYNANITISAVVTASNQVTVTFKNNSAAAIDLLSGNLTIKAI